MKPMIELKLSADHYRAGEGVNGCFRFPEGVPADVTEVELSLVRFVNRSISRGKEGAIHWHVPAFQAWTADEKTLSHMLDPQPFSLIAPVDSRSYAGMLFKIEWCVRIRLRFGPTRKDVVKDVMFNIIPSLT